MRNIKSYGLAKARLARMRDPCHPDTRPTISSSPPPPRCQPPPAPVTTSGGALVDVPPASVSHPKSSHMMPPRAPTAPPAPLLLRWVPRPLATVTPNSSKAAREEASSREQTLLANLGTSHRPPPPPITGGALATRPWHPLTSSSLHLAPFLHGPGCHWSRPWNTLWKKFNSLATSSL
jgi:hypothetical protein